MTIEAMKAALDKRRDELAKEEATEWWTDDDPVINPDVQIGFIAGYDSLAPLLIEAVENLDLALRQWELYVTDLGRDDLENIDHAEATELKRCKAFLDKLEKEVKL